MPVIVSRFSLTAKLPEWQCDQVKPAYWAKVVPPNFNLGYSCQPQVESLESACGIVGSTTQASKPAALSLSAKASAFSFLTKAPTWTRQRPEVCRTGTGGTPPLEKNVTKCPGIWRNGARTAGRSSSTPAATLPPASARGSTAPSREQK